MKFSFSVKHAIEILIGFAVCRSVWVVCWKNRSSGVCVCVCVCVREREKELTHSVIEAGKSQDLEGELTSWRPRRFSSSPD